MIFKKILFREQAKKTQGQHDGRINASVCVAKAAIAGNTVSHVAEETQIGPSNV